MLIDTKKIEAYLKLGTAPSVANKFGLSLQTVKRYRSRKESSAYVDWKGMSLNTAERIMEIINEEEKENPLKFYTLFFRQKPDLTRDININGIDLPATQDRSFTKEKQALNWIDRVLSENLQINYAVLATVKENSDGFSVDFLETEIFE